MSHVLNAAEFRGVNVGEEFYSAMFKYKAAPPVSLADITYCTLAWL